MKVAKLYYLLFLIALTTGGSSMAQEPYCQNLGFELGDFTNWEGYTWLYSTMDTTLNTMPVRGIIPMRQTIISDTETLDENTGGELRMVPAGYRYSARLGASRPKPDDNPWNWNQSLRYTMTIDSNNALLILKFALVLEYEFFGHLRENEPRFCLTLFAPNGDTIPNCANYDVYASNSSVTGFHIYIPPGTNDTIQWRDWTTVGVDLSEFMDSTITIEFRTSDCTLGHHYGYAYFVAECHPLNIKMEYCQDDYAAKLTAPEGFENYEWLDSDGNFVGSQQEIEIANPQENSTYTCDMVSETGCEVSLQSTIHKYSPVAGFSSYMIDCISNIVQITNNSTTNQGRLLYFWEFGDGKTSNVREPRYRFTTSGIHQVSLSILNPPSECRSSLIKDVESFSPPLVDIDGYSTYCPDSTVKLRAYGAYEYLWSNGSTEETIEINDSGEVWLIGRSSTGCADTNYRTITQEPDWEFLSEGDTELCIGDSSTLVSNGAVEYLWSSGDTTDFLLVVAPGIYSVTGKNLRGCPKSNQFNVVQIPPPLADFTLSPYTLNERNNIVTCNIIPQQDVEYTWDMGDSTSESGPDVQHAYSISNGILAYTIRLQAIDKFGCVNLASDIIDVIPYIPNIFSPNGDNINDVFMPGLELQVFDRNGIVLFKGVDGWDGKFNGQQVDPDTYFYSIYYTNRLQQKQNKKGYITLVR